MHWLDRLAGLFGLPSRHDVVLVALPAIFLLVYLVGTVFLWSHAVSIAAASLVSGTFVVDGLFLNPPGDSSTD